MTGINASKIIQNLEILNTLACSSLAFSRFGFFILQFGSSAVALASRHLSLPTFQPTKRAREKKRNLASLLVFLFCFCRLGPVHTAQGRRVGRGGMFANGIAERIKELQAIAAEETVESAEKMTRELNEVLREARADKAHSAAVSAILGKAKILNIREQHDFRSGQIDFSQASSMQDIGRKLLQSVGFKEPDDVSIQQAIQANDAFIDRLKAISEAAQGLTLDQ